MEVQLTGKKLAVGATVAIAMMMGAAFVGAKLALATPGGETRNALSFAGTLRTAAGAPVTAATTLTFTFRKGATTVCSPAATVTPDSAGAFVAQIPIDACPRSLFDGSDVVFDVASGSNVIARDQAVNPVPYARYADRVGTPDCPNGYERDAATGVGDGIVCVRTVTIGTSSLRDEVVRVGTGPSTYWIDRYEASAHHGATGAQLGLVNTTGGAPDDVSISGLSRAGQHPAGDAPVIALSHPGQPTGNITWFQASEACRAAGKRLPLRGEWLAAASGTLDDATCNVSSAGPRGAAATNRCRSAWGVHDMIGNTSEWTDEWYASIGQIDAPTSTSGATVTGRRVNEGIHPWPSGYGDDGTYNVSSSVYVTNSGGLSVSDHMGLPAASIRGGDWNPGFSGGNAGVFALNLNASPTLVQSNVGFRCVVPR